jgi:autotransporter-associated beta strand protein
VLLGNGANDYAGDTTVATLWAGAYGSAARLRLAASEVIPHGAGKGSLVLNAGATVDLNGFSETVNGLWSSAPGALVTNAAATLSVLTVGAADASSSYAGSTGGALSLVKTGGGVLTLSGVCGHSGPTVAAAGTLSLAAACVMTNSAVEVRGGATLAFADGDALGGTNTTAELFADAAARLSIPAGVEVSVFHFSLGGQFKKAGTWGASGSGADFINDDLFEAGGGILRVLATGPQRGTVLSLR